MQQVKGIEYQVDSAAITSSHLRISRDHHQLVRQRNTRDGAFFQYTAVNPQGRGIIYAHTIWHLHKDGTMTCKHRMWKKTRKGKLMGSVDTMWFICPSYMQIVEMQNKFHRKPNWSVN